MKIKKSPLSPGHVYDSISTLARRTVKATGIFVTPVMPTSLKKQRWRRPS
jgi:hypothetical protein